MRLTAAALAALIAFPALADEVIDAEGNSVYASSYPSALSRRPMLLPTNLTELHQGVFLGFGGTGTGSLLTGVTELRRGAGNRLEWGLTLPFSLTRGPALGNFRVQGSSQLEKDMAMRLRIGPIQGQALPPGAPGGGQSPKPVLRHKATDPIIPTYTGATADFSLLGKWIPAAGAAITLDLNFGLSFWSDGNFQAALPVTTPVGLQLNPLDNVALELVLAPRFNYFVGQNYIAWGIDAAASLSYTDPVMDLGITFAPVLFPYLVRWTVATHLTFRLPV